MAISMRSLLVVLVATAHSAKIREMLEKYCEVNEAMAQGGKLTDEQYARFEQRFIENFVPKIDCSLDDPMVGYSLKGATFAECISTDTAAYVKAVGGGDIKAAALSCTHIAIDEENGEAVVFARTSVTDGKSADISIPLSYRYTFNKDHVLTGWHYVADFGPLFLKYGHSLSVHGAQALEVSLRPHDPASSIDFVVGLISGMSLLAMAYVGARVQSSWCRADSPCTNNGYETLLAA